MDKLIFFDLLFEGSGVMETKRKDDPTGKQYNTVEEEFNNFFYTHNLTPLFTYEHKAEPIPVALIDAQSAIKPGGRDNKILTRFANYVAMAQDNKTYDQALFKILYNARDWRGFLNDITKHMDYIDGIEQNYLHNTWNIVFYDKDKSGTAVSKGV